jgi:hypothetical protein
MATGVPNIEISLYTIKTGNVIVPITLRYHGGGIKVNEKATWVGLGWSLDPGGSVIKKTNGLDDIYLTSGTSNITPTQDYLHPDYQYVPYNPGYSNMTDAVEGFMNAGTGFSLDSNLRFMGRILVGQNDGEADEFFYSTPQGSGKFYYNQKLAKFQTNKTNGYIAAGDTAGWGLFSTSGINYGFGRKEHTLNPLYQNYQSTQQSFITAWHLTTISDEVNDKGVSFDYDNYYTTNVGNGEAVTNDYNMSGQLFLYAHHSVEIKRTGDNYVLKKIQSEEGIVNFIKDTASRQDGPGPHALKEIQVYNKDSLLLKRFLFSYYYSVADTGWSNQNGASDKRLVLNSLQEIDYDENGVSHPIPPYYFKYDTTVKLPCSLSFAQDKWGFYNGKLSNTSAIPHNPYFQYYSSIVGANRNVDSNYSKAGMLNGVVYPTGGKATFEYETNKAADTILEGGVRIKKITYYDSVANSSVITEYHYPGTYTFWTPIFWYQLTHCSDFYIYNNLYNFIFTPLFRVESEPIAPNFFSQGAAGYYSLVEKVQKSSQGDILSKHYFTGYTEPMTTYENIMGVPHPKVAEVSDILENQTETYKRETNGTYTLLQKDIIGYGRLENTEDYIWNVRGAWNWNQEEWCEWPDGDPFIYGVGYMIFNISPSIQAYKVYPSEVVKTGQSSEIITSNGRLKQNSGSGYDNTNGNLKVTINIDSKGDTTIGLIKYAADFMHTGAGSGLNHEVDQLLDYNYLAAPIEIVTLLRKKDSTNSILQNAVLYEYENLKPKKVYKIYDRIPYGSFNPAYNDSNGFYKDSHYTLYQEVTEFDADKNPATVITEGNKESYIWYGEDMISRTANAVSEQTAYTSFESAQKGHWTYSGSTGSSYSLTGKKSYSLSGGNITDSSISNIPYVVSYWSRNGAQSINSSSPSDSGRTVNGWKYYEHSVTPTNGIVTVSGSGTIDELRLFPKGSLMTTFTYTHLLGMTSQCDANNRVKYYEYDGMNRLHIVRDQDQNIVKKICYNYAGQPDYNCNPVYYNVTDTASFTRNNCSANYTGSTVVYVVPEGTYSSTISQNYVDSLAAADVSANGQAYANSHGTCISNCNSGNCTGEGYKCINGICEQGVLVATECVYDTLQGTWTNTYHYEWSDNSWSQDYIKRNADSSWC